MGYRERQPPPVTVSYRRSDDLSEVTREWPAAGIDELAVLCRGGPFGGIGSEALLGDVLVEYRRRSRHL